MGGARAARLVETTLGCYPARWRRRHGAEAAELAALLIRDGAPARSVAFSYLAGAAREWVTPRPGRRLSAVACALLVAAGSAGGTAGLLAATSPARAASTSPAHGHAQCRLSLPRPVPGLAPLLGRPQVSIWAAGHGRTC
jgi:hypothetical protein